jgi:hypothetical protein
MTREELSAHIVDVLSLPLSNDRTITVLLSRVDDAEPRQLVAAALTVARELCDQKIRELENDLEESQSECSRLEDDIRNGLEKLLKESR